MTKRTREQISRNMQKVHSRDSKIELLLRRELWQRGLRYSKNVRDILGKPDIVFLKKKIAIFVDSEFWHGYDFDKHRQDFKSHQAFWWEKIERNRERDLEVTLGLRDAGWLVLRFWGKEILHNVGRCADAIEENYKKR